MARRTPPTASSRTTPASPRPTSSSSAIGSTTASPRATRRSCRPKPPFPDGWRIPKPDLIVKMPEPFTVPARASSTTSISSSIRDSRTTCGSAGPKPGRAIAAVVHHMLLVLSAARNKRGRSRKTRCSTRSPRFAPGLPPLPRPVGYAGPNSGRLAARLSDALHAQRQRADRPERGRGCSLPTRRPCRHEVSVGGIYNWQFPIPPRSRRLSRRGAREDP